MVNQSMLHQVIESLVELGGANINMCLHQVHFWSYNLRIDPPFRKYQHVPSPSAFWLYNLMVNPPINALTSYQIIGGAWWRKYQHVTPPSYIILWSIYHSMLHQVIKSLVEQISTCDSTKLYNLMVNQSMLHQVNHWWSKYQHVPPPSAFLVI